MSRGDAASVWLLLAVICAWMSADRELPWFADVYFFVTSVICFVKSLKVRFAKSEPTP